MSFGKPGTMHDWTLDEEGTDAVVAHALDLGITFFDTANGYSAGTSEEYLGKALKRHSSRDQVVIASKVYFNEGRLSSKAIHREIEGTLNGWAPTTWISISSTGSTMERPSRRPWKR